MGLIDADALSGQLNDRIICCNRGSIVEACLLSVLDMINSMPAVSPPPNDPLTLEQLREMDGVPVWDHNLREWGVVDIHGFRGNGCIRYVNNWWHPRCLIGRRFYRRKPEEETTCES